MLIYEVNLTIDDSIFIEYRHWLSEHINTMLQFPGFQQAQQYEQYQPQSTSGTHTICIHYHIASLTALEDYFTQHAARMRAEGLALFPNHVSANRRVLINTGD